VREVDNHTEAVHLGNQCLAGSGESVMLGVGWCLAVSVMVVTGVSERGITDPELMVHAQDARAGADLMQAFNTKKARDAPGVVVEVVTYLGRRRRRNQRGREMLGQPADEVNLLECVSNDLMVDVLTARGEVIGLSGTEWMG
jgi:hypothetical protein